MLTSMFPRPAVAVVCFALLGAIDLSASRGAEPISYNRHIRPLLSDRCFACHGPDESTREADLRLDVEEFAHEVVSPQDIESGSFLERVTSEDPLMVMPPPESGKSLSAEEIQVIRQWVAEGAKYEPHWAFVAPQRSELPNVKHDDWPTGPIDQFVLAGIEAEGLDPSPPADKVTLIRRVTLDLTGLPPTREEVRNFLADDSPEAYEKVVDRLLASSRYGEHMARYWLDAARYGDTHGLHLDNYREMWPYRDWVIKSFNANMRWDDFTIKQLAGDLLPKPSVEDLVASGFNRCHVTTNEGGSISEEVYVRNVIDRVETTGTVFLGMTVGCAVCHDHKFDPISSREFYSMFAFFNNLDANPMDGNKKDHAPVLRVPTEEQQQSLATIDGDIARLEQQLRDPQPEVDAEQSEWEARISGRKGAAEPGELQLGNWHSVGPFTDPKRDLVSRKHGPEGKPVDLAATFQSPAGETLKWVEQKTWADGKTILDFSSEISATFVYRTITSDADRKVDLELGTDDGARLYLNGEKLFDDPGARGVTPGQFKLQLPLKQGENHLLMKIMNYGGASGFHFALASQPALPAEIVAAAKVPRSEQTPEQQQQLRDYYRTKVADHPLIAGIMKDLAEHRQEKSKIEGQIATTLIMKERAQPKPAYFLKRGQYDAPDKELGPLQRAVPAALPPLPDGAPLDRMGFAQWLVDPSHPLPSRVAVNRFWQQCFGTGLVESAEDFGSQGTWPSHPELLDWLAVDFRESGWDVKRMMKQIVMSQTYRQSSQASGQLWARDPQNRLLARGPRFRLDAEVIRDQALAASGLLHNKIGGPGVKPPQPAGLWKAVAYVGSNTDTFRGDAGREKVHRRSIYTFWKRTSPPPQMSTLDAPTRESCVMRRERTNTPLAALLLLNDPQYVEAARHLAACGIDEAGADGTPQAVARVIFARSTLRSPDDDELQTLVDVYQASRERYTADPEAAAQLVAVGDSPADSQYDATELAAWTLVANAVLNLDEVLNKE